MKFEQSVLSEHENTLCTIETEVNDGTVSMKRSALSTCKMQSKCKQLKQQKSVTALCQWHLCVVARFWFQLTPQHREHVEMNPTLKLSRRGVGAMSQLMLYSCKLFLQVTFHFQESLPFVRIRC